MSKKVNPIPEGYHTVTPYMVHKDANEAIQFYSKILDAKELMRMPSPDGKVMHAEIKIGDSVMMVCDENPQMGVTAPDSDNGTHVSFFLYFEDVDSAFKKCIDAGCTVVMPLSDMFWGDRFGKVKDPYGYQWAMASKIEDLTPEEIGKRQEEYLKQMAHSK